MTETFNPPGIEDIEAALHCINPDMPRDDWARIGMALKSELGDGGFYVFDEWSQGGDSYKSSDIKSTWNSINGGGGVGIGTLFRFAKEGGYQPESRPANLLKDEAARLKRRQQRQADNENAEASKREKQAAAATTAQGRWDAATPANPEHSYLTDKGIKPHGIRQEGNNLLVSMQDSAGVIRSLQTITPDGVKRFAKDGQASGMYYRIQGADPIVICEGFATGATINQCAGSKVAIAFSCGNLGNIAGQLRKKYPDEQIIIAADNEPASTTEKARKAAIEIHADLAVPDFPDGESGSDFNDLAEAAGSEAVKRQVMRAAAADATRSTRFKFLSLRDIRQNLKGAQYLINPFLEGETTTVLFGESGAYKSFICLDKGLCIAFGIPYHGHPTNQGSVFYVCGEGAGGIGRRVEAWLIDHDKTNSNAPFYVSNVPGRLIDEGNALEIASIIEGQSKTAPALIIIDTLSTNIGDGDESSNPDIARLMNNVNVHLRDRFGACVLIVHHVGHGDKDRERGAYALRGNADARILVKAEPGYSCSMHSLKVKDGPIFQPVSFNTKRVTIPGIEDSEGGAVSSLVMEAKEYTEDETAGLTSQQQQALAVLEEMHADRQENIKIQGRNPAEARVETREWYSRLEKLKVIKQGASRQARNKIKAKLVTDLLIQSDGIYVFPAQKEAKNDPE